MLEENAQILFHKIATYFPSHYQDVQPLAEGGMGWVYLAKYQQQQVCLKIPCLMAGNKLPEWLMRFQVERDILFYLNHPRIVKGVEKGEIAYGNIIIPYFSMEYCPNGTLRDIIMANGKLEKHIALNITLEIASALDHFHKTGCIYRDLKPENILFDKKNLPKMGDFGTIKHPDIFLTKRGDIIGSFYYCAPEQILNQPLDQSVDVFALGLILFEMVTGRKIGNQIIESWKKQQALMELESDPILWELCSAMLAEKTHRLKSMSAVIEKIYDSHGSQKKIKCFTYYVKDWWYGKSLQRSSKYRSEIVSVLHNIIELVETYPIDYIVYEITRKIKPFPIHLIANEIPGFVADLPFVINKKLAKALVSIRNKTWTYYLISHLIVNSIDDKTCVFLINILSESIADKNLRKEILNVFSQVWSASEINKVQLLLEKEKWNANDFLSNEQNYPLFPLIMKKIEETKDPTTLLSCLEILGCLSSVFDITTPIFLEKFSDMQPEIRNTCAIVLGKIFSQNEQVRKHLCSGMADSSGKVRCSCAIGLGNNSSDIFSISALVTGLFDKNYLVRNAATISLGNATSFTEDVISYLIEKLKDKNDIVRLNAAKSLEKLNWVPDSLDDKLWICAANKDWDTLLLHSNQISEILICLLKSSSYAARSTGLQIISQMKECSSKIVSLLIKGLKNEHSKKYRMICAETLVKIHWCPNTRENYAWLLAENKELNCLHLLGENSIPTIYQNLKDADKKTRFYLLKELSKIKKADKKTIELLLLDGAKQKCGELLFAYADCLTSIEPCCEKEILHTFYKTNIFDHHIELFWVRVLKKLDVSILKKILLHLKSNNINAQIIYIKAIRKKNIAEMTPFLLDGLHNKYFHYRAACLRALAPKITKQSIAPHIVSLLQKGDDQINIVCANIISRTRGSNSLLWNALIEMLGHDNKKVAIAVHKALLFSPQKSIPVLFEKVKQNENNLITKEIINIIKNMGNFALEPTLLHVNDTNISFATTCTYIIPFAVKTPKDAKQAVISLMKSMDNVDIQLSDSCAEAIHKVHHLLEDKQVFIEALIHKHRNIRKLSKKILLETGHDNTHSLIDYFLNGPSNLSYRCAEILEKIGNKALGPLLKKLKINIPIEDIRSQETGRQRVVLNETFIVPKSKKDTLTQKITSRLKQTNSLNKIVPKTNIIDKMTLVNLKCQSKSIRLGKKDLSLGESRSLVFPNTKKNKIIEKTIHEECEKK